jgi:ribonuclease E
MTKRILIDASHAEETRVVVLDGNRLEDFDVETATRKQNKGNIYLAKVIRVEPSLQAAFVEYGGNRHGFLAFGEIHPDYYQIPVADRQRLLAMQAADEEEDRAAEENAEDIAPEPDFAEVKPDEEPGQEAASAQALDIRPIEIVEAAPPEAEDAADDEFPQPETPVEAAFVREEVLESASVLGDSDASPQGDDAEPSSGAPEDGEADDGAAEREAISETETANEDFGRGELSGEDSEDFEAGEDGGGDENQPEPPPPESFGGDGDDAAEARERRQRQRFLRNYKIQEVIHRRQIMLIQVVKEERGNKGAALTTYLSLAGRFSVLMPNSPSGGGVSRKITSVADRRRLKEAMAELDVPDGMGLIVRTAGANRPKPEIKRDCEYLLRLWDDIREKTMASTAPALIYEEASLIKRTIRDVFSRDVDEVLVDGEEGFRGARDFMRMLMPSNVNKVKLWTEGPPLFAKYQVEAQLDAMLNPIVQLRSGGYIVINQTEALVAIDVNSGRSTRERSIEDTALRTNLEAADEAARQLRMRDLAGLIVIDFIDMESRKNNIAVERRLKDALKNDRARIQVGTISHFGLMEMSRQRLRPSLAEASLVTCPHCAGMGHIRSPESAALHILRAIEDEGAKFRAAEIAVFLPPDVALYLFNHKRDRLAAIESRYAMRVIFNGDASLTAANFRIEKLRAQTAPLPAPQARPRITEETPQPEIAEPEEEDSDAGDEAPPPAGETAEEGEKRRRRRRRRGKRRPDSAPPSETSGESQPASSEPETSETPPPEDDQPSEIDLVIAAELGDQPDAESEGDEPARRRRSRGGRRRRPAGADGEAAQSAPPEPEPFTPPAPTPAPAPVYTDIADIFEAAERAEAEAARHRAAARLAAPEPEPEPAPEPPAPEPLVKPILVGADAPVAEKKRGWWRR